MMAENIEHQKEKVASVSLKAFFRVLWKEKVIFAGITFIFILLGFYIAFTSREEFISEGKILPELQSKAPGLGQFAGLASLAGFDLSNMNSGVDAIRPDLYPDVISSTPFFLSLFKTKVRNRENKEMTFENFYYSVIEEGKKKEDSYLKKFPVKEDGIFVLNRLDERRIKDLRKRINASINKKSGLITISSKMPDPVVSADVSKFAMQYLMDYVTNYRTEKQRKEVNFLAERVAVSRGKFYNNQEKKALYADEFQAPTIRLQSADVQRERLESEYRISSSFYNELLKKYEEAKIKLQQETPVFKTLEPPTAPTLKSEPKKGIIIVFLTFFGSIVAIIVIFSIKSNYRKLFSAE